MIQYKEYIKTVLNSQMYAPSARENMPPTRLVPNLGMQFDLREGLPILTGKRMPFYSIFGELVGFMKGLTDVRAYAELGCNVWWDNAYNWNIKVKPSYNMSATTEYMVYATPWCQAGEEFRTDLGFKDLTNEFIGSSALQGRVVPFQKLTKKTACRVKKISASV